MTTYLITGMGGGLARRTAALLRAQGHEVVGVDYRALPPLTGPLEGLKVYKANYNKTYIEDVFRYHRFDTVLHLGRVGNLSESVDKRFDLNVIGTQKIMNLCVSHDVRRLVVLSTFHIYGAHHANHTPISEEDPIRAGYEFPQIADAIQLDNMASTWVYRHPEVETVVLRPTNVVGPSIQNTMSSFLRMKRVPHLLGYNPMCQFIHEDDLARAVIAAAQGTSRGIFNVGGPAELPWRTALELAGASTFPIPTSLAFAYVDMFSSFPKYLVNFFKYPCIISDDAFRQAFGWQPQVDIRTTITSTVSGKG